MTEAEIGGVLEVVRMLWPHSNLGGEPGRVLSLWSSMLVDFTGAEVEVAVRSLAFGREHAPPVGVVVAKCAELAAAVPPWDVAWPELERKARECVTVRGYRIPAVVEFSHRYVGEFARLWWRDLCPLPQDRAMETLRAQLRDAYRQGAGRAERERAPRALGAAAVAQLASGG